MRTMRDCSVAVVGGAGFLGSHLVDHLINDRNCRVVVIDNLVVGRREFVHHKAEFIHHDITTSEEFLHNVFRGHRVGQGVQYVFNYCAYPYIPDSFARPKKVCDVNFMGAINVINAAQEAGVEAILQVSSAEIYGGGQYGKCDTDPGIGSSSNTVKIDEEGSVIPHSSYGVAKAAVDNYVQCRWREAKTPCIALRQFNCVGERETHPYVVPEIIGQISKWSHEPISGPCVVKLGNDSFRDFMYAGDAVRVAVELLERGQYGEVYNLGSESGIKIYELAKLIGKVMGFTDVVVEQDPARVRPWEIWFLTSCNDKIRSVLKQETLPLHGSMTNMTPLEAAIKRTVEWYTNNGRRWPWEGVPSV